MIGATRGNQYASLSPAFALLSVGLTQPSAIVEPGTVSDAAGSVVRRAPCAILEFAEWWLNLACRHLPGSGGSFSAAALEQQVTLMNAPNVTDAV
jgi:hypothetical protein